MPPVQTQQDLLAESVLDKARSLNQQFCQNFNFFQGHRITFLKRRFARMPKIQVTESGVLTLLAGLKPSKAAGPDGLHPIVLKEMAPVITPAFAFILQKSLGLDRSSVPEDWRVANVCPLFRKGDRSITTNYRPISKSKKKSRKKSKSKKGKKSEKLRRKSSRSPARADQAVIHSTRKKGWQRKPNSIFNQLEVSMYLRNIQVKGIGSMLHGSLSKRSNVL